MCNRLPTARPTRLTSAHSKEIADHILAIGPLGLCTSRAQTPLLLRAALAASAG